MYLRNIGAGLVLLASVVTALPQTIHQRASGGGRLTVYWGAEDDSTTLSDVCADKAYKIVVLAFLDRFFAGGGYPSLSLSPLNGPSQAQQSAGATNLQDGSSLVSAIKACQASGKQVLLSLGGANGDVTLQSDSQGEQVADTIWNLFGGGTQDAALRPFGSVKLDGFDFDNESGNPTGYAAMASRFRSNYKSDTSKTYYLSGAPQCPYPDASIPLAACQQMDYVWVQFYNNGNCNVGKSGFTSAVRKWSSGIGSAELFIGAVASAADGDQGYVSASTLVSNLHQVQSLNLTNYGGAMLWEAQLAVKNGNYQEAIAAAV